MKKLLAEYRHTFSKTEIGEALLILAGTRFSYSRGKLKIQGTLLADFPKAKMYRVILPSRLFTLVVQDEDSPHGS
jgi:hypothetical protein